VIIALWNRPDRAIELVQEISRQDSERPLRLLLWNNQRKHSDQYRLAADALENMGALGSIELVSSPLNIGGIGRFFIIQKLRRRGYSGPVVMIDDDQVVHERFVQDLLDRWSPRSIVGVWAFRQHGAYWNRSELSDAEEATYVGTGGCACDASIVDDPSFFSVPDRYSFIEDQWMSFRARTFRWRLAKATTAYQFVLQDRNQYHGLVELKEEFFRFLYDSRPDLRPE
jgi:hypothetical protein